MIQIIIQNQTEIHIVKFVIDYSFTETKLLHKISLFKIWFKINGLGRHNVRETKILIVDAISNDVNKNLISKNSFPLKILNGI